VAEDFIRPREAGVYVKLRVSPGAKNTETKGSHGEGTIKLAVAAPPTEGKANAEVERYLAVLLGVSRAEVAVVKGTSSRDKLVFMRGIEPEAARNGLVGLVR
jgi:uncharacterized protein